jgi:hypothetical protein
MRPEAVTSLRRAPGSPRRTCSNCFSSPSLPSLNPGVSSKGLGSASYSSRAAVPT